MKKKGAEQCQKSKKKRKRGSPYGVRETKFEVIEVKGRRIRMS
jgi:hypothetical protein